MTLRRTIATRLTRNLVCAVLLVASFLTVRAAMGDVYAVPVPSTIRSAAVADRGEVAALLVKHRCWTGDAPADMQRVIPGHVVMTVHGATRVGGERMVGKALEQVFNGTDFGLTVHGFCR